MGSSFDAWTFRPAFSDSWISETHAQESEALTKALQQTLFSSSDNNAFSPFLPSDFDFDFAAPTSNPDTPTTIPSSSDPDSTPAPTPKPRNGNAAAATVPGATGKVTKRKKKPRAASKKSKTTFIVVDPANFRKMVQQVTGYVSVVPALKPEPHRFGGGGRTNYLFHQTAAEELAAARGGACLPTLDTSALFLDLIDQKPTHEQEIRQKATLSVTSGGGDAVGPLSFQHAPVGGGGVDFDSFSSFPTLESWEVLVESDSLNAVEFVNGGTSSSHPYLAIVLEIKRFLLATSCYKLSHIFRETNRPKMGHDQNEMIEILFPTPPQKVAMLLEEKKSWTDEGF